MRYPARYDAREVDREGIGPLGLGGVCSYSGGLARGEDVEYCLIALPDALAEEYAEDPDMEIVDVQVAQAELEINRVAQGLSETVLDEPVEEAQVKAARGETPRYRARVPNLTTVLGRRARR